jgi:hypothetical protein
MKVQSLLVIAVVVVGLKSVLLSSLQARMTKVLGHQQADFQTNLLVIFGALILALLQLILDDLQFHQPQQALEVHLTTEGRTELLTIVVATIKALEEHPIPLTDVPLRMAMILKLLPDSMSLSLMTDVVAVAVVVVAEHTHLNPRFQEHLAMVMIDMVLLLLLVVEKSKAGVVVAVVEE